MSKVLTSQEVKMVSQLISVQPNHSFECKDKLHVYEGTAILSKIKNIDNFIEKGR